MTSKDVHDIVQAITSGSVGISVSILAATAFLIICIERNRRD